MIRKYHNHKLQTTQWHGEEEPLNHHETPGRQIKQSNQLSLPHQDDCNTKMDIYVTIKIPLTYRPKPLVLYKITSVPVPINETSSHSTTLLNPPTYFLMSDDNEYYASMSGSDVS